MPGQELIYALGTPLWVPVYLVVEEVQRFTDQMLNLSKGTYRCGWVPVRQVGVVSNGPLPTGKIWGIQRADLLQFVTGLCRVMGQHRSFHQTNFV